VKFVATRRLAIKERRQPLAKSIQQEEQEIRRSSGLKEFLLNSCPSCDRSLRA